MSYLLQGVTLHALADAADSIKNVVHGGDVIILIGDVGAGKTTFVSSLAKALHSDDEVTSPTFAILAEYECSPGENNIASIIHIDTYRLTHVNELYDLGIENLFRDDALTVVEWGERIEDFVDRDHFRLTITEESGDTRNFTLEYNGPADDVRHEELTRELARAGWTT